MSHHHDPRTQRSTYGYGIPVNLSKCVHQSSRQKLYRSSAMIPGYPSQHRSNLIGSLYSNNGLPMLHLLLLQSKGRKFINLNIIYSKQ